jgi:hypothetical protein
VSFEVDLCIYVDNINQLYPKISIMKLMLKIFWCTDLNCMCKPREPAPPVLLLAFYF